MHYQENAPSECGTFALSQKHCDEITAARSLILNYQFSIINYQHDPLRTETKHE